MYNETTGIAHLSIIPIRREPNERSEMVSQLLFGEQYKVIGAEGVWLKIETEWDGYQGWIGEQMHMPTNEDFADFVASEPIFTTRGIHIINHVFDKIPMFILHGSVLPGYDAVTNTFKLANGTFEFHGQTLHQAQEASRDKILKIAFGFLNAPYLWGGKTIFGIDCSGFVQIVFKIAGIKLLRDASQQFTQGHEIEMDDVLPGDLAFFGKDTQQISHVGIILDNRQIIHSSGKVRIDTLDSQGIYNKDTAKYTHKLICCKSVLTDFTY